jgi:exodeoxyribonuclease VII large subunit
MNLFTEKKILTVSQLTSLIRGVLEENFDHFWVEGEVSNLATPASGHVYFTLKDAGAMIRCVMFRAGSRILRFCPENGMKLIVRGRLTVFDQRGDYQLFVEYLEPLGVGALQLAFQQLKERLSKEGLFSEENKRALPILPRKIGIITSPTGAAVHDILNVITRRFAGLYILIYPVKVQGEGAAREISVAIRDFNRFRDIDVLILARGGGSLEDLWPFNEEIVARAIYSSKIPIISAIGHEIDVTISDLVADLRAPTPSAAAELVVKSKSQLVSDCTLLEERLQRAIFGRLCHFRSELHFQQSSLKCPDLIIGHLLQRADDLQQRLDLALSNSLSKMTDRLAALSSKLHLLTPLLMIERLRERVFNLNARSYSAIIAKIADNKRILFSNSASLDALSPLNILGRGYSLVSFYPTGIKIISAAQLQAGDHIELQFADGKAECEVENIISCTMLHET